MKRGCGFLLFSDWAPVLSEFRLRATVGGMTHLRAMPKRLLALLMMSLVLTGCANRGTPLSPQTLTFNYAVRTVPDAAALIASVRSGQAVVSDLLARDPCNFTADFSSPTPPQVFTNGVPGKPGSMSTSSRPLPSISQQPTRHPALRSTSSRSTSVVCRKRWRSASRRASPMAGSG